MNKRYSCIINGRKGGRPKSNSIRFEIPDTEFVILTPAQYSNLIEKYGFELFRKALNILENWLKSSPHANKHRGKNNYALFRSDGWVINSAKNTKT